MALSIMILSMMTHNNPQCRNLKIIVYSNADCRYADGQMLIVIMLTVLMLIVKMLIIVILMVRW